MKVLSVKSSISSTSLSHVSLNEMQTNQQKKNPPSPSRSPACKELCPDTSLPKTAVNINQSCTTLRRTASGTLEPGCCSTCPLSIDTNYYNDWSTVCDPSLLDWQYAGGLIKGYNGQGSNGEPGSDTCYIYTPGTGNSIDDNSIKMLTQYMAANKGMCAAAVEYPFNSAVDYYNLPQLCNNETYIGKGYYGWCSEHSPHSYCATGYTSAQEGRPMTELEMKSKFIFDANYRLGTCNHNPKYSTSESDCNKYSSRKGNYLNLKDACEQNQCTWTPIKGDNRELRSAVVALEDAGCNCKNIVSHGFSQGAHIAALAKNYNDNVKKTLMFSGGCESDDISGKIGITMNNCEMLQKPNTKIPVDAIRDVSTENDNVLGCTDQTGINKTLSAVDQIKLTTGVNCTACLSDRSKGVNPNKSFCDPKVDSCCEGSYGNGENAPISYPWTKKNTSTPCSVSGDGTLTPSNIINNNCLSPTTKSGYYIMDNKLVDDLGIAPGNRHGWGHTGENGTTTSDIPNKLWDGDHVINKKSPDYPWTVKTNLDWLADLSE